MDSHIHTSGDTICAISTAPGVGGIAVARVSGENAIEVVQRIWRGKPLDKMKSHTAHLGTLLDSHGEPLDQAVITLFLAPASFTGENVVELGVHGSLFVQRELLNALMGAGARLAEHGEFTRRAFVAKKIDLAQAEAVADVIASNSRAAHRIAMNQMRGGYSKKLSMLRDKLLELASLLELELDFSEEEVEFASRQHLLELAQAVHSEVTSLHGSFAHGAALKQGIPVAIVGATNAGKSSLLNALLGDDRAIVSDIHGTTRDVVEDTLEIGDYLFRFMDTAGLRSTTDTIEQIGITRSLKAIANASIVLLVIDPADESVAETYSRVAEEMMQSQAKLITLVNKSDLNPEQKLEFIPQTVTQIAISCVTMQGLDTLRQQLSDTAKEISGNNTADILVTNARHAEILQHATQSSSRIIGGLTAGLSGDFIAQDVRETIHHLGAITGTITTTDILTTIFSRFCIGK
ncbi:MAG: tRNA uridine-5-carboxymethylaminomethyl(34) synthesis GTPase MnmE [Paramuribaculum sp.]|nr:tRNA uridine-5-carboxymethylaminomethyl(34) synthesis GTPase MnmE [Paramuribaculum sp.]